MDKKAGILSIQFRPKLGNKTANLNKIEEEFYFNYVRRKK